MPTFVMYCRCSDQLSRNYEMTKPSQQLPAKMVANKALRHHKTSAMKLPVFTQMGSGITFRLLAPNCSATPATGALLP